MLKTLTYIPDMQIKNAHKHYFSNRILLNGLQIIKFSCLMLIVGFLMVLGLFIIVGFPWLVTSLFI